MQSGMYNKLTDPHYHLYKAVKNNVVVEVKRLLATGIQPDSKAYHPLKIAAAAGNATIVELLLDAKANPDQDYNNLSPLDCAAQCGHSDVVLMLLRAGAKKCTRGFQNAANNGFLTTVYVLLEAGIHPDTTDEPDERTALLEACEKGHRNIVDLLLLKGAKSDKSRSVKLKKDLNHDECYNRLVSPAPLQVYITPETPLLLATLNNHPKIVVSLLQHGADVSQIYRTSSDELMHYFSSMDEKIKFQIANFIKSQPDPNNITITLRELADFLNHYEIARLIENVQVSRVAMKTCQ